MFIRLRKKLYYILGETFNNPNNPIFIPITFPSIFKKQPSYKIRSSSLHNDNFINDQINTMQTAKWSDSKITQGTEAITAPVVPILCSAANAYPAVTLPIPA